ncbi:MAG: protein kinase [bacterium]|nr:protein kinase [bacterium]
MSDTSKGIVSFWGNNSKLSTDTIRALSKDGYSVEYVDVLSLPMLKDRADILIIDTDSGTEKALKFLGHFRSAGSLAEMPVIIITDNSDSEFVVQCFDLGANDVVVRSEDFSVFLAHVRMHLRGHERKSQNEAFFAAPGDMLNNYLLEEVLGAGGMGVVFEAKDTVLDRQVAIKILTDETGLSDSYAQRFLREGQIMAKLNDPQVVKILDFGTKPAYYIVMERVSGSDIDALIAEGKIEPVKAARIIRDAALVLHRVHEKGIIHRDLKPGNIIVDDKGVVHLLDFGISKLMNTEVRLTTPGMTMGTPAYMAPEQIDDSCGGVDATTDVYSLGIILYEMIIGKLPQKRGGVMDVIKEIMKGSLKSMRAIDKSVPEALDSIVLKATSRRHDSRYRTAKDFADALTKFIKSQS